MSNCYLSDRGVAFESAQFDRVKTTGRRENGGVKVARGFVEGEFVPVMTERVYTVLSFGGEDASFEFVGTCSDTAADEDEAAVPSETLEDLVIEWGGERDGLLGKSGKRKSCSDEQGEIAEEAREQGTAFL